MEDADAGNARTRANQHPKVKYIKLLQDVADRKVSDIVIELDDIEQVGIY
jgi:DNA replication licensing factor MCM7